jgi:GTPase SAR1 family protein
MDDAKVAEFIGLVAACQSNGIDIKIPTTKTVFLGHQSAGKSSLMEGLVGQIFNYVGDGAATKTPQVFYTRCDPSAAEPLWHLKAAGRKRDNLTTAGIAAELQLHNESIFQFSSDPAVVTMTWKSAINAIFVDLPGLQNNGADANMEIIFDMNVAQIVKLLQEDEGIVNVVTVEATHVDGASKVDPDGFRSRPLVRQVLKKVQATVGDDKYQRCVRCITVFSKCDMLYDIGADGVQPLKEYHKELASDQPQFMTCFFNADTRLALQAGPADGVRVAIEDASQELQEFCKATGLAEAKVAGLVAFRGWMQAQLLQSLQDKGKIIASLDAQVSKYSALANSLEDNQLAIWVQTKSTEFLADFYQLITTAWGGAPLKSFDEEALALTLDEEYEQGVRTVEPPSYRQHMDVLRDYIVGKCVETYEYKIYGSAAIRRAFAEFIMSVMRDTELSFSMDGFGDKIVRIRDSMKKEFGMGREHWNAVALMVCSCLSLCCNFLSCIQSL